MQLTRPNITLRSAPGGHWAVLAAPRNDPVNAGVVVDIRPTAHGGVLRDLEITGGFYYGARTLRQRMGANIHGRSGAGLGCDWQPGGGRSCWTELHSRGGIYESPGVLGS